MYSKLIILLLGLTSVFTGCVVNSTQYYKLDYQTPDRIRLEDVDYQALRSTYDGEDGVYLSREYVIEIASRHDYVGGGLTPTVYEISAMRYLVFDPDAEWLGTFNLELEEGKKLNSVYISVISPDGTVQQFSKNDLREEVDSKGNRRYQLAYPGIVEGSLVDEGYEIVYDGYDLREFYHQVPLQYSIPCEDLSVRYIYNNNMWSVELRGWNNSLGTYRKIIEEENAITIAAFEAENLPAYHQEPYSPYYRERVAHLEGMIATYLGGADNWSEFAEGGYEFFIENNTPRTSYLVNLLDEIVDRSAPDAERVKKIMNWMYLNFTILPADDKRASYGNIHNAIKKREGGLPRAVALTYHLLKEAGFEPSFLLAHSIEDVPYTEGFVYPGTFPNPALRVTTGDTSYYLFPYIKNYPVSHIPFPFEGQPTLRVVNGGFIGVDTIPVNISSDTRIESEFDVNIDEEGKMKVKETRLLYGDAGFGLRRALEDADEEEKTEAMKELIVYEAGEYTFNTYELENQDDYNKPLVIRLDYTVDDLVTITPEEVILQTEGLFAPSLTGKRKVKVEERENAIKIYSNEEFVKKINMEVPSNWVVQELPEDREVKTSLGELAVTYSSAPGKLSVEYHRRLHRAERPASDYPELLPLISTRSELTLPTLIFSVR